MGLSGGYDPYQVQNMRKLPETIKRSEPDYQPCSNCGKRVPPENMILWNGKVFCEKCYKELKELSLKKEHSQKMTNYGCLKL